MGKKKRGHPDVEELLSRPWCYYCERDFEDLKLLISHQKAKHFKCDRCGKRLNTAGGLSVHMNQVHKESLEHVENALANRQSLDIEIFGMEGIPEDIVQQHNQRIIQNFYQEQAERHAATGNPPPGAKGGQGPAKKIKIEDEEELKKRLAEHKARRAAQRAAVANGSAGSTLGDGPLPGQASGFPQQYGQPGFPPPGVPGATFPPGYSQNAPPPSGGYSQYPASSLPARPPNNLATAQGLPQRPPFGGTFYPSASGDPASTIDDLVASASRQGDDIDQLIRMAEAGIKPPKKVEAAEELGDRKSKKEKAIRMIYMDADVSPEERMAQLPKYAFNPEAVQAQ